MRLRPFLRIAARDALQHRARSILVLVMIALPVLAVTATAVVIATADVSASERLDRRLGSAASAQVVATGYDRVVQNVDPEGNSVTSGTRTPAGLPDVRRVLGPGTSALEYREGSTRVSTPHGVAEVDVTEIDLRSPLAAGLTRLVDGRLPRSGDEVVITPALAQRGLSIGGTLTLTGDRELRIVGTARSADFRTSEQVWGPLGSIGIEATDALFGGDGTSWLVGGSAVTWSEVRRLNDDGMAVLSRHVMAHPPSASEIDPSVRSDGAGGLDSATVAVAALVVVMALLEVVLLAGPAFAVGARRQSRTLALIAACGGTPRQARRVILAGGVVLGSVAAVAGVVLGLVVAVALLPVAQRFSDTWFGHFEVPYPAVAGIALFGLLSALLAAVVPAWLASRQDVVAVLAGRRGDRPPSVRSPILGVALLVAGVLGAGSGARASGGEYLIAVSALVAVLGMILVIPVVVALLARLGRRLPLPLRYAVRDAARHRTRTVPAVAAVAATVAGVVALGIGSASDAAESRATYSPQLPRGEAAVQLYDTPAEAVGRVTDAVRSQLAGADVTPVRGVGTPDGAGFRDVSFVVPGRADDALSQASSDSFGAAVLVARRTPDLLTGLTSAQRDRADAVLARGGAVVLASAPVDATTVRIRSVVYDEQGEQQGRPTSTVVPAYYLVWAQPLAPASGVVAPSAAVAVGAPVATVGLAVTGTTISTDREKDVREAVGAIAPQSSFYVERGYVSDGSQRVILLVLGALGAVLMLGGTLTATFLALSDARPDLATLSAVGAAPRTRRGVAAAYAVVIGLVGAVLGAAVGFVPGIAVSYPLTSTSWTSDQGGRATHYLDIPWLLVLVLVVALPLATALIVGVTARSRLPLVARLD